MIFNVLVLDFLCINSYLYFMFYCDEKLTRIIYKLIEIIYFDVTVTFH